VTLALLTLLACGPGEDEPAFRGDDGPQDSAETVSPCPQGMVFVASDGTLPPEGLCIDAYEGTVRGDLGPANHGFDWPDPATTATVEPLAGLEPTVHVSWYQAYAACANSGKHLCTTEEWQASCASAGTAYPWGNAPEPDAVCAAVDADEQPVVDALQPSGAFPGCVSTEGAYDQLGNAWEWTDSGLDEDGLPVAHKVGGAWYAGRYNTHCAAPPMSEHAPDFEGTIGVRCCAVPVTALR
jgi:formylglycine-generating enzyme required for sulfatase activity